MKKYKLLFLIIPFLIVIIVCFLVDDPLPKKEQKKSEEQEIESSGLTITLVVGKTGSLKEGGYEPIYEEPDETSEVVSELEYNCAVIAEEKQIEEGWVYVDLIDKGKGYIDLDSVEVCQLTIGSENSVRDDIIRNAFSYLGLKFVRYGESLSEGIDCSNFISRIYAMNNIQIPNRPVEQRSAGSIISEDMMQPGDIIFYDKANNGEGHVGIYLGEGFVIHSSGHSGKTYPKGGVRIVRVQYPDRESYQVVNILDNVNLEGAIYE